MRALDAAAVAAWAGACVHALDTLRAEIDGMNVYPIADSDTGSNLLHTMAGADRALTAASEAGAGLDGAGPALAALARGAVAAARGNSGVIVSQVVRGFARAATGADRLDGPALAEALADADRMATGSVAEPVEGTMLTVLRAAAEAAGAPTAVDCSAAEVASLAAAAATEALARTPEQLPALAVAGVVDAGGRGLVAVLDALRSVTSGGAPGQSQAPALPAQEHTQAWEVMYLLDEVDPAALPALRTRLSELGESVTVAGDGDGRHAVHVHCTDIGAAIEVGIEAGRPQRIRVEPLLTPSMVEPARARERAVVGVVRGPELAQLLRDEGVAVLALAESEVAGVEQLLGLIAATGSSHVTVLPGGIELSGAAERAAGDAMVGDTEVVVVPCASPVQVLAALAVHDPARRASDDVVAMAEAAAATRRGELVVAAEEALTWVGRAHPGDMVGFVDDEVAFIEPVSAAADVLTLVLDLLGRMLALGGELVTVLTGSHAPPDATARIADGLRAEHPEVEVACYPGGQADAVFLIGVE